jgi:hypothetical protein
LFDDFYRFDRYWVGPRRACLLTLGNDNGLDEDDGGGGGSNDNIFLGPRVVEDSGGGHHDDSSAGCVSMCMRMCVCV